MAIKLALAIQECAPTPVGPLWVGVSERGLVSVGFCGSEDEYRQELARHGFLTTRIDPHCTAIYVQQIQDYLEGRRCAFDFPLDWSFLTPFQAQVLQATYAIPYGEVRTYGELAVQVGRPRAARAVGRAQATNPMPIVIPCHRVVGTDGKLHGYGGRGGLKTKQWLLDMESRLRPSFVEAVPERHA